MQQLTVMVTLCVSKKSLYVIVPTAHFVCTLCCDKFAVYMTSDCGPVGGGGRGGGALGQGVGGGGGRAVMRRCIIYFVHTYK